MMDFNAKKTGMLYPAMGRLTSYVPNRYLLVNVVARRARQIAEEAEETGTPEKFKGTVSDYYDSDVNPLFELEIGGRQVLIPAAEEFIAHIDFEARTMHLVLPEGLLTLE